MKKLSLLILPAIILLVLAFKKPMPAQKDKRPNIIIILADDMGFSDAGCYGGEIHTPNLDYLATNGLRFTQFYNTSRCCPSRASLLTGLYNHQAGIGKMTTDDHQPGYRGYITENTVTLAEVLKSAGYHTAMSGKWHVSNTIEQKPAKAQMDWLNHHTTYPAFSPLEQYPTSRGFEKYFGTLWGVVDYFDPFSLVSGTTPIEKVPANYYHTDAINDTAVAYIKELSGSDQPFFLYVAENAPHWPIQALPEDIEKYKDTYKAGWDVIRAARYKKMAAQGIINPAITKLSPRQNDLQWQNNPDSAWDARAMAVHAAMVDRMDQGIGRIINALKATGQLDNTVIFFLSDNGASPENCAKYGPGFDRPDETRTGEKIVYDVDKKIMPGAQTSYASIGPRWSNVANTPFRYWKAESYEGGIHTPMIAYWPKGIKKGITPQTGHVMDFMATCIDLAKTNYPRTYKGHQITPMQGISLLPVLQGKQRVGHEALFNEHFGARYARYQNWKLVKLSDNKEKHLYDLSKDPTEIKDLADKYPEKVKMLDSMWQNWASANNVLVK
jgi:arylsulfatase